MSQHWHGHWIQENYKPSRLGNWEVPNWFPEWPDRHCRTTTFQCDSKGHLLPHIKKTNRSREYFKTTWELPKKIDRHVAEELSAPPKYKKRAWEVHKAYHRAACGGGDSSEEELKSKKSFIPQPEVESKSELNLISKNSNSKSESELSEVECRLYQSCKI